MERVKCLINSYKIDIQVYIIVFTAILGSLYFMWNYPRITEYYTRFPPRCLAAAISQDLCLFGISKGLK